MLLPLIGFIVFSVLISTLGILFLLFNPNYKLNIQNILVFDFGAVIFVVASSIIYGKIFANDGTLESTFAVIAYFAIILVMIFIGGILGVNLLKKFGSKLKRI